MADKADKAPAKDPARPLAIPNIESIPKRVVLADDFTSIKLDQRQEADFLAIRAAITRGAPCDAYYRASSNHDRLLKAHQVIHLHLGGKNSDVILYLVQYPAHVLFVCITTHRHLESTPPGSQLQMMGRRRFEARQTAERRDREAKLLQAKAKLFAKPPQG